MNKNETLDYNSPHFTLVLIETDIPVFTSLNRGMLGESFGLFQLKNRDETIDAFEKADNIPVVLVKPTKDYFRTEILIPSALFLSGKIKLLLETTFYLN